MLFNSLEFIFVFLPISLILFYLIGKTRKLKLSMAVLVFCSLIFYGWWKVSYLFLLLSSIVINYCLGYLLNHQLRNKFKRKLALLLGIIFNLGLIGYYKYANFFVDNFNLITNQSLTLPKIILPLAISFFTFQQIAYLVDAYQGQEKEDDLISYSLFVTFFPQLIAGPIVRHQDIIPQFQDRSILDFNKKDLAVGITIFILGLFKKVIIADGVAPYANQVFQAASEGIELNFMDAWIGALAYTFQLYFDFSGYSEMAIGAARMFGIKLPINFNSPYQAINISDFWRRWHITLSNFLRDYLYIPLGGNRQGELKRYGNLMITMLLGGLWHGAGWTFILWGGLHGLYLCINRQWNLFLKSVGLDSQKTPWWSRIIAILVTFLAVIIAWVLFRADNLQTAIIMLRKMSGLDGIVLSTSVVVSKKRLLLFLCLFVWLVPNTMQLLGKYQPSFDYNLFKSKDKPWGKLSEWLNFKWKLTPLFGIIAGILLFIVVKSMLNAPESEFLYFNF
jgi:D-alanyl-lipoteichoic acid acyltransferase DltB (MBOAT superfamily)